MLTKVDLEKKINESEIFSLNCNDNPAYYDTIKRKFYLDLTNYYLQFISSSIVEQYGLELIETANDCLRSFKTTAGVAFLHYFGASFSRACKKSKAAQVNAVIHGAMHITAEDSRDISKILKFFDREQSILCDDSLKLSNEDFIAKASYCLGIDAKRIKNLITINENSKTICEWYDTEEEEDGNIFDFIADSRTNTNDIEEEAKVIELFDIFDTTYSELQARTKPIIKDLFTVYVLKSMDFCKNVELMQNYDCFDVGIINNFVKTDNLPTARDISNKYGVNEASSSRTLKSFIEKIKNTIKR